MIRFRFNQQERQAVQRWIEDEAWSSGERYRRDEEYLSCVQDILQSPVFERMDSYYQHGSTTCKEHCIRVSYLSYKMCKKYGWDYREAARAGLLHDLFLYDWHTHSKETGEYFHGFTHPKVAMNNAVKHFDITEREKDIILRHMWPLTPIPPRHKEGYAIVYADKFCSIVEIGMKMKNWFVFNLRPVWGRR